MSQQQLTPTRLEARDLAADTATLHQRIEHFRTLEPNSNPPLIVTEKQDEAMTKQGLVPEVDVEDFTISELRNSLAAHGALIVRNFFPQESIQGLIATADRVIDACDHPNPQNHSPDIYYNPPEILRTIMPRNVKELGNTRTFHRESGSAMCVEAPCVAEALLRFYEAHGVKDLVTEYLEEAPCLTVKKWVLRRSKLPVAEAGWHQDGAFMGTNINSINMWLPLNECGGETGAPGMDVVPRRLTKIASAEGAQFDWSVSDSLIGDSFSANRPVAPVFNAGDVFFFDHFYLHRTQYRTDFTKLRYAVETWFFGQSAFPKNQIPLAW